MLTRHAGCRLKVPGEERRIRDLEASQNDCRNHSHSKFHRASNSDSKLHTSVKLLAVLVVFLILVELRISISNLIFYYIQSFVLSRCFLVRPRDQEQAMSTVSRPRHDRHLRAAPIKHLNFTFGCLVTRSWCNYGQHCLPHLCT